MMIVAIVIVVMVMTVLLMMVTMIMTKGTFFLVLFEVYDDTIQDIDGVTQKGGHISLVDGDNSSLIGVQE